MRLRRVLLRSSPILCLLLALPLLPVAPAAALVPGSEASLSFNGTSQYVGFGDAPTTGVQSFTIETWFRRTAAGVATSTGTGGLATVVPLVTKGRGEGETPRNLNMNWFLGIDTKGTGALTDDVIAADFEDTAGGVNHPVTVGTNPGDFGGVTPIQMNTWYHAAATYDQPSGTWRLFLNGALERQVILGSAFIPEHTSIQDLGIGSALTSNGTAAGFFAGQIDEVRVWNTAHTMSQIRDTLNQEVTSATGLVARWGLNEGTGTTVDDSVGATDSVTFAGTPTWSNGYPFNPTAVTPSDYALDFTGTNSYVDVGNPAALNLSEFTLEAWIRKGAGGSTTNTGNGGVLAYPIISKGRAEVETPAADINYFMGIDAAGHLVADFEEAADGATPGLNHPVVGLITIPNDEWHHVATTYDGTTMAVYVDGVLDRGLSIGQPPNTAGTPPVGIGTAMNSRGLRGSDANVFTGGSFDGSIDEVRIWDTARTQEEIQASKDVEVPGAPGLLARYGFNEGSGTLAGDSGGDDHSAIIFNAPWISGFSVGTAPPTCVPNCALDFSSASQQYVSFGDPNSLDLSRFTVETWFRRDGAGVFGTTGTDGFNGIPLVTHGSQQAETPANVNMNWYLGIDSKGTATTADDVLAADFEEAEAGANPTGQNHPVIGQASITDGVWHHAAATYDGDTWTLYLDGNLDQTLAVNQPVESASTQPAALATSIQTNGTTLTGFFDGVLDEARVWNRALSQSEIQTNMSQELTAGSGLVARWGLNAGTGNTIGDSVGTAVGNRINAPAWVGGAPFGPPPPPNDPPGAPVIVAPTDGATAVAFPPTLDVTVADPNGDTMDVAFYGRPAAGGPPAPDFTVVAIPDTQHYVDSSAREILYRRQTEWIVDSRAALNTRFVTHLGDIVEHNDTSEQEWIYADAAMDILDDNAVPNNLAPGNHDLNSAGVADFYDEYFPPSRYDGNAWYGSYLGDPTDVPAETTNRLNKDNYELFEVGGLKFLVIHLEVDMPAYAIAWAQNVIDAYPDRRVIISTHLFLSTTNGGTRPTSPYFRPDGTSAQDVWTQLIAPNCNVFLVLNGHYPGEARRVDDNSCGDPVHQVESDYQSRTNGGDGWLRYMTFEPSQNEIEVFTFSPTRNGGAGEFETDSGSRFTLGYQMENDAFTLIGTDTGVADGTHATTAWNGLDPHTEYEWYAVADDGRLLGTSATASFTTGDTQNSPPVLGAIGNKTVDEETQLAFTATATDADAGDALVFSLAGTVPAGASIGQASGAFTWMPMEDQDGPHVFDVCVSDGTDEDCETIMVTVNEVVVNSPPVLGAIGDKTVDEGTQLTFTATATDPDGGDVLGFSLANGASGTVPTGATIDATTGAFTWTPTEAQDGLHTFDVCVFDGTDPDCETIGVTVNEVTTPNSPPVLGAIGNKTVNEGAPLTFTATASDADVGDTLMFSLAGTIPAGAAIGASTGGFAWTPTEAQDGLHTFDVCVSDGAVPDCETITVTVNEVAGGPLFADTFESGTLSAWVNRGLAVQQLHVANGAWAARSTTTGARAFANHAFPQTHSEIVLDAKVKVISQSASSEVNLLRLNGPSGGVRWRLYRTTTGMLALASSSGTPIVSSTALPVGGWHDLRFQLLVGKAGRSEVWLDGVKIAQLSVTQNFGTALIGGISIGEYLSGRSADVAYDDVVADTPAPPVTGPFLLADDFESGTLSAWVNNGLTVQTQHAIGTWAGRSTTTGQLAFASRTLAAPRSEVFFQAQVKLISKAASSQVNLMRLNASGGGARLRLFLTSAGTLALRPSSGADLVSTTTLTPGVFHEIQLRLLVGTAGQSEVWLDGVRIAQLSVSQNFGTGLVAGISIGERQTGRTSDVAYDEVLVDSEQIA